MIDTVATVLITFGVWAGVLLVVFGVGPWLAEHRKTKRALRRAVAALTADNARLRVENHAMRIALARLGATVEYRPLTESAAERALLEALDPDNERRTS